MLGHLLHRLWSPCHQMEEGSLSIRWVIRLDRWLLGCSTAMKSTFISFVLPMHILLMRRLSSICLSHFVHGPWWLSPELYSPNETTKNFKLTELKLSAIIRQQALSLYDHPYRDPVHWWKLLNCRYVIFEKFHISHLQDLTFCHKTFKFLLRKYVLGSISHT